MGEPTVRYGSLQVLGRLRHPRFEVVAATRSKRSARHLPRQRKPALACPQSLVPAAKSPSPQPLALANPRPVGHDTRWFVFLFRTKVSVSWRRLGGCREYARSVAALILRP